MNEQAQILYWIAIFLPIYSYSSTQIFDFRQTSNALLQHNDVISFIELFKYNMFLNWKKSEFYFITFNTLLLFRETERCSSKNSLW